MRVLLDTQVFLWLATTRARFTEAQVELLESSDTDVYLSVTSAWEITIKHALGKIDLPAPPMTWIRERIDTAGITVLPVELEDALHISSLPLHHGDPFDRMLISQAQVYKLTILTSDRTFERYDVEVMRV